jgi:hypothetical protein
MVVIDEKFNGYRDLILPMAETDASVRNSVIAAGAHHFALRANLSANVAQSYYTKAINELLRCSKNKTLISPMDNSPIASLVILLICDMITGCDNFKTLFNALRCSVKARGEVDMSKDRFGQFLLQQIRKHVMN